ncbi:MAG: carbohydrate binding family 9 domain-containing protein, partial [Saprospiraceae bacterium]|nr:carbohydrate binding family 9 domain-containing protein [Saprospiraceae bacterium]
MRFRLNKTIYILAILICVLSTLSGQESIQNLNASFISDAILLDGKLDEASWKSAEEGGNFWQFFPTDSIRAKYPTTFKILYSETTLYVGIRAESIDGNYVVSSLRRDFDGTSNDNVSLLFDTFNDGTTAYFFGVTPYGVRREGLVTSGGTEFNNTWDIKWLAEAQRYEDHYTVEIAIPFTSLKFIEGAAS